MVEAGKARLYTNCLSAIAVFSFFPYICLKRPEPEMLVFTFGVPE